MAIGTNDTGYGNGRLTTRMGCRHGLKSSANVYTMDTPSPDRRRTTMHANSTDAEIRGNAAFPLVVRAARLRARVFWLGLPVFAAVSLYGTVKHHSWAIVLAALTSVAGVAGQLYGFRQARQPLSQISDDRAVQDRATKLATDDAKPRLLRRVPGA
jgi:hypothetical protein